MRLLGKLSPLEKAAISLGTVLAARKLFSATLRKQVQLRDKVVLITGGSRGFGFALAKEFGRAGCRMALTARDQAELAEAEKRLQTEGISAVSFPADLTDRAQIVDLVNRVLEHFGRIDILINNAGIIYAAPFDSIDEGEYERAMDLMFWAPLRLSFAVLPQMQAQGSGHIVNITSIGGRVSVPHLLPYSCAKFAAVGFSNGLSVEAKSRGVHVMTVVPGLMRTGSYLEAEFGGEPEKEFAWFGILGNLPGFSVAAQYAASQVRKALENRRFNCTISLPAKMLIALDTAAPETTRALFALTNRFLPQNRSGVLLKGKELNPRFGRAFQTATALGHQSAAEFNQGEPESP